MQHQEIDRLEREIKGLAMVCLQLSPLSCPSILNCLPLENGFGQFKNIKEIHIGL